jgi:hypothetical protein
VQRLLKAVEPERGLFQKKSTAFRVAAVQGLGEGARTPEAWGRGAQGPLRRDKDEATATATSRCRIARRRARDTWPIAPAVESHRRAVSRDRPGRI